MRSLTLAHGSRKHNEKDNQKGWTGTCPRRRDILFDFLTETRKKGPSTDQRGSPLGPGGMTSSMKDSEGCEAGWTLAMLALRACHTPDAVTRGLRG